jgi:hypothetical protein
MPDEKNKQAAQSQPGFWDRIRNGIRDRFGEPPPPEPPSLINLSPWRPEFLRSGAMDSSRIGQIGVTDKKTGRTVPRDVTLGEVPNILFNEYRSITGSRPQPSRPTKPSQPTKRTPPKINYAGDEQLRRARSDTAYAIFNDARYAPGTKVAPPTVSRRARQSPEYARNFKDYQNTVWNAFAGYMMGQDPVEGRGYYNRRYTNSTAPRMSGGAPQPLYRQYGPFRDVYQNSDAWLDIYGPPVNPAYAQPKPPKGQK